MTWMGWVALALLLFWALGAYNRLIQLRAAVLQAFGRLDTYFVRGIALIGDYQAAIGDALAASDAADAHAAVQAATTQFGASLAVARAQPLDGKALAALAAGTEVLDSAWRTLVDAAAPAGEAGNGIDLEPWARQREALRQQSLPALGAFNEAVQRYNGAVAQFPASALAWLFGFHKTQGL